MSRLSLQRSALSVDDIVLLACVAEPVKATGDDVEKAIAESLKPEYLPEIVDDDQEEGRREIAIAELVKPHKKMKMRGGFSAPLQCLLASVTVLCF